MFDRVSIVMRTTAWRRLRRAPVTYSSLQDKPEWQGRSASDLPVGSLWRQARPFASLASEPRGWGLSGSVWTLERRINTVDFRSPWWILSHDFNVLCRGAAKEPRPTVFSSSFEPLHDALTTTFAGFRILVPFGRGR